MIAQAVDLDLVVDPVRCAVQVEWAARVIRSGSRLGVGFDLISPDLHDIADPKGDAQDVRRFSTEAWMPSRKLLRRVKRPAVDFAGKAFFFGSFLFPRTCGARPSGRLRRSARSARSGPAKEMNSAAKRSKRFALLLPLPVHRRKDKDEAFAFGELLSLRSQRK